MLRRYSQKQLYDLVSDVDAYHQFLPYCTASRVLYRPPSDRMTKEPWKVEMTVGFMGIEQRYVSEVSFKPNERVEVGSTLLIKVLVN